MAGDGRVEERVDGKRERVRIEKGVTWEGLGESQSPCAKTENEL